MSQLLHSLINRGIKEDDPIEVRRQIGLLNIATLCAFTVLFFFMVLNVYHHTWILLVNNFVLLLLIAMLPFIHKLKHFNEAIIVLCILFSAYFFANDVLFHNAQRYILLPMMVVSVLLIQSNTWRIVVLSLQISFFMLFLLQNRPPVIEPLPAYRGHLLTFTMLVILAITLQYFKRKQLQYIKNLSALNKQLQDSNQVKERMLSILSHDFNAPMANLVSTLNLVDAEILTPQQFNEVSVKLQAQLNVLTTSFTDVLNWSKLQINGDTGIASAIPLKQLVNEVALLFKHALDAKSLYLVNSISPTITAYANKEHIKLVFRNLLSNAIKFSNTGKKISVTSTAAGGRVSISITDEGTGITPAVLEALQKEELSFNSRAGTANERGTGLGLMLVREFLQKSGGSLTIESVQDKGSTFTAWLPASS